MNSSAYPAPIAGLLPSGSTELFTIIGHPVVQVQAPGIFNRLFAARGEDAVLVPVDLAPGSVAALFEALRRTKNYRGGFVTVPHKQEAARAVDELTPRAAALGVVNAVKRVGDVLVGDMTDGAAFLHASRASGLEPAGARVGLIGGGGTATAIAHACAEAGVAELVLSVRNKQRHDALRRIIESVERPPRLSFDLGSLEGFDLVVNGTSVGMGDDPNVPHPTETLDPDSLIGEVVTLPRITPWLAAAIQRGCRIQYGIDMTKAQGQLVAPWWGLEPPPVDAAEE